MVAVVADSASNVPAGMARDLGIGLVPIELRLGDEIYQDGVDMVGADFYDRLVKSGRPGTTSAPPLGSFLEAYRRTGDGEIVCVTLASALSASNHNATLATEQFDGRVEVVDSQSATLGEGFVAIEAARAARDGRSLEEVAARARDVAGRMLVLGAIQTFEFLRKSGRVGKLQAYAATMLDIKPVFRLEDGVIVPIARPRTRSRALGRIVDEAVRAIGPKHAHLGAFQATAEDDARDLVDRIGERVELVESFVVDSTPAIGAHTGPGLVGVAFFCDR